MKQAHNHIVDIIDSLNGLIHEAGVPADICLVKHEESAPSASTNTRIAQALREIAASMEQMALEPCQNGTVPIHPATLQAWARQLRAGA